MDFRLQMKMIFLNDLMCAALCHAVRCGTVWHSDEIVLCTCCYSNVSSESSTHIQTNKREKKNTDTPWKCSNNNNLNNNESKFYFKEQKKTRKMSINKPGPVVECFQCFQCVEGSLLHFIEKQTAGL